MNTDAKSLRDIQKTIETCQVRVGQANWRLMRDARRIKRAQESIRQSGKELKDNSRHISERLGELRMEVEIARENLNALDGVKASLLRGRDRALDLATEADTSLQKINDTVSQAA